MVTTRGLALVLKAVMSHSKWPAVIKANCRFVYLRELFKIILHQYYTVVKMFCFLLTAIPNTAFPFSAISMHEKKKGSINEESEDSEEDQEPSPVPNRFSQQWLDGDLTVTNKSLWPAITFWLALTTPNGAPANPLVVHRALLECGMGATATQVIPTFKISRSKLTNGVIFTAV